MLKPGVAVRVKSSDNHKHIGRNGVIDHIVDHDPIVYAVRLFNATNPIRKDGVYYFTKNCLIEIGVDDMYPEVAKYCEHDIAVTKEVWSAMHSNPFGVKRVIFNDPATIVMWNDGAKTVVKAGEGDDYDPEKGLAMAITKKALGNKGDYYDIFRKWLPKDEENEKLHFSLSFIDSNTLEKYLSDMFGSGEDE